MVHYDAKRLEMAFTEIHQINNDMYDIIKNKAIKNSVPDVYHLLCSPYIDIYVVCHHDIYKLSDMFQGASPLPSGMLWVWQRVITSSGVFFLQCYAEAEKWGYLAQ